MSVAKELEEIASEICDNYCRWPHVALEMFWMDKDVEREAFLDEKCKNCPLMRLV